MEMNSIIWTIDMEMFTALKPCHVLLSKTEAYTLHYLCIRDCS